jgi:glutamate-1-semialdehyde 2,1-aminomutase
VTQAAVRIARQHTGRKHVLSSGYHGHHDFSMCHPPNNGGVLEEVGRFTHKFDWGNYARVQRLLAEHAGDIAAIIVEVPPVPWGDEHDEGKFLDYLRQAADTFHALFILDEVVTGFRYALGGAQALFDVTPDLACFGKALANGYPLAVLVGKKRYMQYLESGQVFLSTTSGGDAVSLAAARATLEQLSAPSSFLLKNLHAMGMQVGHGMQYVIEQHALPVQLYGNFARMTLKWHNDVVGNASAAELHTLWLQETCKRGVLFGIPIFPMTCWDTYDVERILQAADNAAFVVRRVLDSGTVKEALECPIITGVFVR